MEEIIQLKIDGELAYIYLNRKDKKNALNTEMLIKIQDVVNKVNDLPEVKVCIFKSTCDDVFSAGADISERKGIDLETLRKRRVLAQKTYKTIEECDKVTIAVVNGKNFGGGIEIATACDFIISSYKAEFCLPEVRRGTLGATQRISRILHKGLANYYLLTGEPITAEDAFRIGLTAVLVDENELEDKVLEIASKIASYPEKSLRLAKRCVQIAQDTPLDIGLAYEIQAIETISSGDQWKDKVDAFLMKKE